ncbi:hypothetical protein NQ317_006682, partial [Molorchus minor]
YYAKTPFNVQDQDEKLLKQHYLNVLVTWYTVSSHLVFGDLRNFSAVQEVTVLKMAIYIAETCPRCSKFNVSLLTGGDL